MLNALDRIIPILCIAIIIWPFAVMPFAFVSALLTVALGFTIAPAFVACVAFPLSIFWAGKVWEA
jgi:hypothetical protein